MKQVACRRDNRAKVCPASKRITTELVEIMWNNDATRSKIADMLQIENQSSVTARIKRAGLTLRGKSYDCGGWQRRKRAMMEAGQ